MRFYDKGTRQTDAEEPAQKHKNGLREDPDGECIQAVEHDGADYSRERVHEADGTEDLSDARMGDVLGDGRLNCSASQASQSRDHSAGEKEMLVSSKRVSNTAEHVRRQGKPKDPDVQPICSRVLLNEGRPGLASQTSGRPGSEQVVDDGKDGHEHKDTDHG